MNWLVKYKFYLLPWVVLLVYLLAADPLYSALFVKNGMPAYEQAEAFEAAGKIQFSAQDLIDLNTGEEDLYELIGWAFMPEITDLKNIETQIVLRSVNENLVFDRVIWRNEKLNEEMPEFKMDLTEAGFRVNISMYALEIDNYQIGILITDKTTGEQYFQLTGSYIERTPNRLRFIK